MQILYASNEINQLKDQEQFLKTSYDKLYELYLLIISLLIHLHQKAENYHDLVQQKHLATEEEKNPSKKFISNQLLIHLANNTNIAELLKKRKIKNWDIDSEYVDLIFKELRGNQTYQEYLATEKQSFHQDREVLGTLFKDVIAVNEKLYEYLEDKEITWIDDFPVVNTTLLKQIRKAKESLSSTFFLPELFRDEEDEKFGYQILRETFSNEENLVNTISENTKNWDQDRITPVDKVLLKMAICELLYFPTVPVKVTINEYLEIAKEYSTPKSSVFINGILDKLVKEYTNNGTLNKSGRGLL
ncbi:MAG: transcription antitermination factor NusB [bacterium]